MGFDVHACLIYWKIKPNCNLIWINGLWWTYWIFSTFPLLALHIFLSSQLAETLHLLILTVHYWPPLVLLPAENKQVKQGAI